MLEQQANRTTRKRLAWRNTFAAVLVLLCAAPAWSQVSSYGEKSMGDPAPDHLPDILSQVQIAQRLNQKIPLDATFRDEQGREVRLGDYFGKRPVILALVYYRCQILCSEELSGLVGALEMVRFMPGKDYEVVVVSFDPAETPQDAAAKKAQCVARFGRKGAAAGWHFLTGNETSIQALTHAVGFGYVRVPGPEGHPNQYAYAHASSIQILTPGGRLAQYYMGVEYSPRDLMLGLVEASHHQIGTPVENLLTYCYRYDPKLHRHSLAVVRVVQSACMLTVVGLGAFMVVNFRRDFQQGAGPAAGQSNTDKG